MWPEPRQWSLTGRLYASSMSDFPKGGPWSSIRADLQRKGRSPVIVVIGYVGSTAEEVMPLRKGDTLVCDASRVAIRQGLTSAQVLARYHKAGVTVASCQGLHAKVVASKTWAWIGSANASTNSRDKLFEASLRVTGAQARQLHEWATSMATEDRELTDRDFRELKAIPVVRPRPSPEKEIRPITLPDDVKLWHLLCADGELSEEDVRDVKRDRGDAHRDVARLGYPSDLSFVYWWPSSGVKRLQWLVHTDGQRVQGVGQVVRVSANPRGDLIWYSPVKLGRRPKLKELFAVVPRFEETGQHTVGRGSPAVSAVSQLFRAPIRYA